MRWEEGKWNGRWEAETKKKCRNEIEKLSVKNVRTERREERKEVWRRQKRRTEGKIS